MVSLIADKMTAKGVRNTECPLVSDCRDRARPWLGEAYYFLEVQ